jgi:hypothetical protein
LKAEIQRVGQLAVFMEIGICVINFWVKEWVKCIDCVEFNW